MKHHNTLGKLFLAVILIGVLALCYFVVFAVPAEATDYSDELLKSTLFSMLENGETERTLVLTKRAELENNQIEGAINDEYNQSGRFAYLTSMVTHTLVEHVSYRELVLELHYVEDRPAFCDIPEVKTKQEAIGRLIDAIENNKTELVMWTSEDDLKEDNLFNVADVAELNALSVCISDTIDFGIFPEDGSDKVIIIGYNSEIDGEKREKLMNEVDESLEQRVEEIKAKNIVDEKELYRAIHDVVVENMSYDYALGDASRDDTLTLDQKIQKTVYGALIEGETVCTGYAYTFKELCDRLGVPCWVVSGDVGEDGHVWNAVAYNGVTYYIDCTFDDTGGSSYTYFMFSEDDWQFAEYSISNADMIPW